MTVTEIKLKSPFNDDCIATFNCQFSKLLNDEAHDVVKVIRFISNDYPQLENILKENTDAVKSFDNMKILLNDYNKWIDNNKYQMNPKAREASSFKQASNDLIKYIMLIIYNRAVLDPDKLNHYEPFSPQVYGETSFDLIDQMLKRVALNENDVFMDLGSGVGNVVLHVAAASKCKHCYGFEKAEWPAFYASKMEKEFKFWMKFFDKSYSDFNLYKADFLSDEEYIDERKTKTMNEYVKEIINEANLIFVNNYAFGAEVDHQLKLRFCNMLEGAFILSSKPFCSLNFRINSRNLNDIGAILNIDFEPLNGHVSWTDKPINYFFHKIDRTLLEKYFESKKNPTIHHEHESGKSKLIKSQSPSSVSSTSSPSVSPSASPSSSSSSSFVSSEPIFTNKKKKSGRKPKYDDEDEMGRGRKKSNKRKQSPDDNKIRTNTSSSLISNKRAKLNKKTSLLSKSLNREQLSTLNKMHNQVVGHNNKKTKLVTKSDHSFNNPAMTSLRDENLSNKLLKDCKISPKLLPIKQRTNILGDDVNDAINNYLKKLKKHYVDYLMFMKSPDYREKIQNQINNENKKAENLLQIETKRNETNELLKQDVLLLKQRAEEIGISCLESPKQLMDHAKEMLEKHQSLLEKLNHVQSKINSLEMTKNDTSTTNSMNTSNTRLKNTFDSLKKLSNYFNPNQKMDLKNLIKTSTDECFRNQLNIDLQSIESSRSTDETLTATERGDDDDFEDQEYDSLNDEELKETNKKLKQPKPKPATNNQQVNPVIKYEKLLDQEASNKNWRNFKIPKKTTQTEEVKALGPHTPPGSPLSTSSFASSANSMHLNSNSASNTETIKYSSVNEQFNSNNNQVINQESNLVYNNTNYSNHHHYQQHQMQISSQYHQKQSYQNYYHSKKNQFRQYAMDNSSTSPFDSLEQTSSKKY